MELENPHQRILDVVIHSDCIFPSIITAIPISAFSPLIACSNSVLSWLCRAKKESRYQTERRIMNERIIYFFVKQVSCFLLKSTKI